MLKTILALAVYGMSTGVALASQPSTPPPADGVTAPPLPPSCVKHCGGLKHNKTANRHLLHDDKGRVRVKDVPGLAPSDPPRE